MPAVIKIAKAKEIVETSDQILTIHSAFYKACKSNKFHSEKCFNHPQQIEANYAEFDRQAADKLSESQKAILKKIGECESGFQMKPNATGVSSAYGIFQTLKVHDKRAKNLGVTRYTREGNIKTTINLFLEQGTTPWNASKHCWKK